MTNEQFKDRINSMLEDDKEFIQKLITKAINSGAVDIDSAPDNFMLPKMVLAAIYKEMYNQRLPLSTKDTQKEIDNIGRFL